MRPAGSCLTLPERIHAKHGPPRAPEGDGPSVYACPMHPDVVSEEPGHPKCGMRLLAVEAPATTYTFPMYPDVVNEQPGHGPECGMKPLPAGLSPGSEAGHAHHPPRPTCAGS